jgi:DEAD/DEAH box helicase domain-containing protein
MDAADFLDYVTALPDYRGQAVHVEHILPRNAVNGKLDEPLAGALRACLTARGVRSLYAHQASAVNLARINRNVMVATPSASGKTLCYNVAVLQEFLGSPTNDGRAIYLFPTKALAHDQFRVLRELACPGILSHDQVATFDGDTPAADRPDIRKRARIVMTNPDMLHVGIMPNHQTWARFLRSLKYVVVDEAHVYRGVFGSHVANVLRRLRRLCSLYGARPRFIMCSATIANPGEHAERLTGLQFDVVDGDGSPHGGKDFVFWNPPFVGESKSTRVSANGEAINLFTDLVRNNIRTLTFARTRRLTEVIYTYAREKLRKTDPVLGKRIKAYRAGYLPAVRRQIEEELFSGRLIGVVATVALELGVDIGDLDATVLTGYPGSIASTWQQAGRSGRRKKKALSFLIGLNNPLDQYFMRNPGFFFGRSFENALVNPENPYILRAHLLCASWETPLTDIDEAYFGAAYRYARAELEAQGVIRERQRRWYLSPSIAYPAQAISIRSAAGQNYQIVDSVTNAVIETVEGSAAFFQIHTGAVYLHQGQPYLITKLDLASHTAHAQTTTASYYTQTKELTDLHITRMLREKFSRGTRVCLGEVEVTTTVTGFKKKAQYTEEIIGEEPLSLPPQRFPTVALWFDLPSRAVERVDRERLDFHGGLHAAEHAAIGVLPLFALCDRNDIGGVSTPLHPDTAAAQIFIYDGHPGGVGIAERGFDLIEPLWEATLKAIGECPCEDGCPSCIQSPKCGNNNEPLDKAAARILLEGLLGYVTPGASVAGAPRTGPPPSPPRRSAT